MRGVLYIILCFLAGTALQNIFIPKLKEFGMYTYGKKDGKRKKLSIPGWVILLPARYLIGSLFVTWSVYLLAYKNQEAEQPLAKANKQAVFIWLAVVLLSLIISLVRMVKKDGKQDAIIKIADSFRLFFGKKDVDNTEYELNRLDKNYSAYYKDAGTRNCVLFVYMAVVVMFVSQLMYRTFHVAKGKLFVGLSVFSDFAPHIGMIRSFSRGNNFPTQYSHFAGEDIRYHFMFQFMAGNLEFLGLRIDHAFNIPSILGMVSVFFLLFVLATKLSGRRACGYIATLLFAFRSSLSVFKYFAELNKSNFKETVLKRYEFLGYTTHEDWGLWNLNVYCNQRHLAFSLAIMLLAIIVFLPYVFEMADKLANNRARLAAKYESGEIKERRFIEACHDVRIMFCTRTAFAFKNPMFALFMGFLLGGIAFWNGSVLIATMIILFFMAAVSDRRLDYLLAAIVALFLGICQSRLFIEGSAVAVKYQYGFLADNKTLFGCLKYFFELTGLVLPLGIIAFCLLDGVNRYMMFVFSTPIILAFTTSFTIDITVNHKFVMMGLMLVSVYLAYFLGYLWEDRRFARKLLSAILVIALTATGFYEYRIIERRNTDEKNIVLNLNDPITKAISDNSDSKDIFLSSWYALNDVVFGGAMLYLGWPYYAWSAGYDTDYRTKQVKKMYEADSPEELRELIEENNIRFIIVDHDVRTSGEYCVREDVIAETYTKVYSRDTNEWEFAVYDTQSDRMWEVEE